MKTRFIARLLTADDRLLSWAEVWAEPKPQDGRASCPFMATPGMTKFLVEEAGTVAKLVVHWPDLDVARARDQEPLEVQPLQVLDFVWFEPVWLVSGMSGVVLPAVTLRAPVVVAPPPALMGAKDGRLG